MLFDIKRFTKKIGQAPGTLSQHHDMPDTPITAELYNFSIDSLEESQISSPEEINEFVANVEGRTEWINLDGIHHLEWIRALGKRHALHPLVMEDIVNPEQRAKLDEFDQSVFIVLRMLSVNADRNEIQDEQVSIVLGPGYVLSFQEFPGDVFDGVRKRLREGRKRIRTGGPDYLAYALMDSIVDHYYMLLENLGDRIEVLEHEVSNNPTPETLEKIHKCKREMLFLRKAIWPLREVISGIQRGESPLFSDQTRIYMRDVYDHTIQVIDTVETLRDIASGLVDLYLSSVSHRMNEVMKVLTIIATIFIPLTFIAGIYGMNFARMPELQWDWGYPAVLGLMGVIAIIMVLFFKRRKWF